MKKINTWYTPNIQKKELWGLIKIVGKHWEEDKEFLESYAKGVYERYKDNLKCAIDCFKSLEEQIKYSYRNRKI